MRILLVFHLTKTGENEVVEHCGIFRQMEHGDVVLMWHYFDHGIFAIVLHFSKRLTKIISEVFFTVKSSDRCKHFNMDFDRMITSNVLLGTLNISFL